MPEQEALTPPYAGLTEGIIYQYNLDFGGGMDLAAATNLAKLAYAPYSLPSFCLPPKNINSVRIFHGSCRKPHGSGPDALALLDAQIQQAASNPTARPHQLLLMGDQIYADDVAPSILLMLSDASDVLLKWQEVLPVPAHWEDFKIASKISPFMRVYGNALGLRIVQKESLQVGAAIFRGDYRQAGTISAPDDAAARTRARRMLVAGEPAFDVVVVTRGQIARLGTCGQVDDI